MSWRDLPTQGDPRMKNLYWRLIYALTRVEPPTTPGTVEWHLRRGQADARMSYVCAAIAVACNLALFAVVLR